MSTILIAYGTTEGHTRSICERIAEWLHELGYSAELLDTQDAEENMALAGFDGFIVAGSLHQTQHQIALERFVSRNAADLAARPSLFLSSSLTASGKDDEHQAEARKCIEEFCKVTKWQPTEAFPIAGALLYSRYDWLKKAMMRFIVARNGGDTDDSRDYVYTDWDELRSIVERFAQVHLGTVQLSASQTQ
jgi:menaquinone-dependent protoporphyrinogen oxidase